MEPLTLTELDEFEVRVKEVERALKEDFEYFHLDPTQVLRAIAAARASIPRPIAESPRDGTFILVRRGSDPVNWVSAFGDPGNDVFDSPTVGFIYDAVEFISIPKGGVS